MSVHAVPIEVVVGAFHLEAQRRGGVFLVPIITSTCCAISRFTSCAFFRPEWRAAGVRLCGFGLLAGAGLLGLSLHRVMIVPPGFRPDHPLSGALTLPAITYDSGSRLLTFADLLAEEISRRPGVLALASLIFLSR